MQSIQPVRVLIVIFFLLAITHASNSWQRPQRNDESSVADAVKYLQELDNYYSHLSRPRLQNERKTRSVISMDDAQVDQELEAAIALLRLDALDRIYSRHSRPRLSNHLQKTKKEYITRFGKRNNDMQKLIENEKIDDVVDEWHQAYSRHGER